MNRQSVLTWLVLALGVLITVVKLRNGLEFSFMLVLGVLLVADGVLRLLLRESSKFQVPGSRSEQ